MGIMILIMVTLFFFLPYYMNIFLLNEKKTKQHMLCWIGVVSIMVLIEFIFFKQSELISLIILIGIILYYFFTYIFYVRNIDKKMDMDIIKWIVKLKYFKVIFWGIIVLIGFFAILNILLIFVFEDCPILIGIYLSVLIIMGYLQTIIYGKEYLKLV